MARVIPRDLLNCTSGAVAPTVALALVGLIAAGGLAFDYARLMGMHSELQNGADQAALAAASQLDGKADATKRAAEAAAGLVANLTRISNDGSGSGVGIAAVAFYQNEDRTGPVTRDDSSTTDDKLAHFVEITVNGRQVFYALTPIVSLISSGNVDARAMAGLGQATCKVPPVMICNPAEATDPDFTVANYIGKGLKLVSVGNGGGAWAPGNFGYLDTSGGSNGAPGLREGLGWTTPPGDCSPQSGVDTKPGATVSVTDALNTRFDIYDNQSCPAGGSCPPSANSVKDLVKPDGTNGNGCRLHNQGWQEASNTYLPNGNDTLANLGQPLPDAMGHPRDICHAYNGTCSGVADNPIGTGLWDINAYFAVNYAGATPAAAGLAANATRYEVYKWEMANAGSTLNGQTVLGERTVSGALKSRGTPYCSTPGVTPGGNVPDRRRMSLAVVNCTANSVNGNSTNVPVQKWIDMFLVEPSLNRLGGRTGAGDIYVEVIAEASANGDGTAGQVVRRDVPHLVR